MSGYDPAFLGVEVPLPTFSPALEGLMLSKPEFLKGYHVTYVNYTLAMNTTHRSAAYVASNIDQALLKKTGRKDSWYVDSRIGDIYQLNNDYYRDNPWDRGHLARRDSAAWGKTQREAQNAADATFYYSNACLQHENFNQDEWLALEDWVQNLKLCSNQRISVFCGPIYGDFSRSIKPTGRPPTFVPSAFFKVVCFINKMNRLEVRAFIMTQDVEALRDKGGRRLFNYQNFQVSVTDIEQLTGLTFPDVIPDANPLYYHDNPDTATERANLNVTTLPERIEVDHPDEMVDADTARETILDDKEDVFIAAALVNPKGLEREEEWVSIINLTTTAVNLENWKLKDARGHAKTLTGTLAPGQAMGVKPVAPVTLSNKGGAISLYNDKGARIDRVAYTEKQAKREGVPIVFPQRDMRTWRTEGDQQAANAAQ